jgi:hypothetical protein
MALSVATRNFRVKSLCPGPEVGADETLANPVRSGTVSAKSDSPTGLSPRERRNGRLAIFRPIAYIWLESSVDEAVANPVRSGTKQP